MQRPRPGLRSPPRAPAVALRRRDSRTLDMRMTLEPGRVLPGFDDTRTVRRRSAWAWSGRPAGAAVCASTHESGGEEALL